jgi:hypothetical protein
MLRDYWKRNKRNRAENVLHYVTVALVYVFKGIWTKWKTAFIGYFRKHTRRYYKLTYSNR